MRRRSDLILRDAALRAAPQDEEQELLLHVVHGGAGRAAADYARQAELPLPERRRRNAPDRKRALAQHCPGADLALVVRPLDLELLDSRQGVLAQLAGIRDLRSLNDLVEQTLHL